LLMISKLIFCSINSYFCSIHFYFCSLYSESLSLYSLSLFVHYIHTLNLKTFELITFVSKSLRANNFRVYKPSRLKTFASKNLRV
jgi:hypothetical protein